jgi:hypothetical protein
MGWTWNHPPETPAPVVRGGRARSRWQWYSMDSQQTADRHGAHAARSPRGRVQPGTVAVPRVPRPSPVLPAGWAPLTRDQQAAVLQACDRAPSALVFRAGAATAAVEYRVYRLDDVWAGLCVVSVCDTPGNGLPHANRELLGLASADAEAVALVLTRVNAELQAAGRAFKLELNLPAVPPEDPRRV